MNHHLAARYPCTKDTVELASSLKEATVKRFDNDDRDQLRQHLQDFIDACDLGLRLKTLEG